MKREIDWQQTPLVPGIVQDSKTKNVLMMGYLNQESYEQTLKSGLVTFYSRSKGRLWVKGEESGNSLEVEEVSLDCDADSILLKVNPLGPTCHTLKPSCFHTTELEALEHVIDVRSADGDPSSYVKKLLTGERKNLLKKIGEEASEVVVAMAIQGKSDLIEEIADLVFHLSVGMHSRDVAWNEVLEVLQRRRVQLPQ